MYNFDVIAKRKNTSSYKWNVKEGVLPMWVADMDFKCADPILNSIKSRCDIGALGYSDIPEEYFLSYINFFKEYHNVEFKREEMFFSTGVVPSLSSLVRSMTNPDDNVVILTPVYNIFFNSIRNNKRNIVECPLNYINYEYSINFDLLEEKLKNPKTTMIIFCNPQNPTGNIWSLEDLTKVAILANKYNVLIVSDEIHCDITKSNHKYNSFYNIKEAHDNLITLVSATKCFNMAGCQASMVVIPNKELYKKANRGLNTDECAETNFFGVWATIAAFNESRDWLFEMNKYVDENFEILNKFIIDNNLPIHLTDRYATYLGWLDIKNITLNSNEFEEFLIDNAGLYITSGSEYGKTGDGFMRINLATNKENVIEGLNRLKKGINLFLGR